MTNVIVLGLAVLAAIESLFVFLFIAKVLERRRAYWSRRLNHPEDEEVGLTGVIAEEQTASKGWAGRLDQAFETMIQRTMLNVTAGQALGYICLAGVVLGAALFVWRGQLWLTGLGLVLGSGAILSLFMLLQSRYRRQMQNQLPDVFYLMARSLRAGLTLEQTIELVGKEGLPPLADEFRRASGQINLGLAVPAALRNAARRIRLLDFDALASAVGMHYQFGGNLTLVLDRLAAGARDRNQFRNYFLAATAFGRLTTVFLAAVGPALLLSYIFFQPEHVQAFFESRSGWMTLVGALCVQALGGLWLYQMFRIEF